MTTPLIVGNWKMNTSLDTALALATATAAASDAAGGSVDVGICPPYPWIVPVANAVRGASLRVGAQDCAATTDGAHTGDVSATMIAGHCTFTLIGHSERRHQHHESDDIIHAKLGLALDAGLSVILCVGETKEERDAGREHDVVNAQLRTALAGIDPDMAGRLTIAYEPVWSIGTGNAATDDDAAIMAREIRATLSELLPDTSATIRILYGGSANANNTVAFLAADGIDGLLVGGASLSAETFAAMIESAASQR